MDILVFIKNGYVITDCIIRRNKNITEEKRLRADWSGEAF